jgi:hypothetical protein
LLLRLLNLGCLLAFLIVWFRTAASMIDFVCADEAGHRVNARTRLALQLRKNNK